MTSDTILQCVQCEIRLCRFTLKASPEIDPQIVYCPLDVNLNSVPEANVIGMQQGE